MARLCGELHMYTHSWEEGFMMVSVKQKITSDEHCGLIDPGICQEQNHNAIHKVTKL